MSRKLLIIVAVLGVVVVGGYCGFMYFYHQSEMKFIENFNNMEFKLAAQNESWIASHMESLTWHEQQLDSMGIWVSAARKDPMRARITQRKADCVDMKKRLALGRYLDRFKGHKQDLVAAFEQFQKGKGDPARPQKIYEAHRETVKEAREAIGGLNPLPGSKGSADMLQAFRDIVTAEEEVTSKGMAEISKKLQAAGTGTGGLLDQLELDKLMKSTVESTNQLLESYNRAGELFVKEQRSGSK